MIIIDFSMSYIVPVGAIELYCPYCANDETCEVLQFSKV